MKISFTAKSFFSAASVLIKVLIRVVTDRYLGEQVLIGANTLYHIVLPTLKPPKKYLWKGVSSSGLIPDDLRRRKKGFVSLDGRDPP